MDTFDIMASYAEAQGWTQATQLLLLLDYIDNQQQPEAFADFLAQAAETEEV